MLYSEYAMLVSMFISPKLASASCKVQEISYNRVGKGMVFIKLVNGERKIFSDYLNARNWCLEQGVLYVV